MILKTSQVNESATRSIEAVVSKTPDHEAKPLQRWITWLIGAVGLLFGLGDDVVSVLASSITPKKVRWLWHERIPLGKLTLFVGDPDNGKSMAALYVASITTTGKHWYSPKKPIPNDNPPSKVLIFADEDDKADTAVPRLEAAGADCARVHLCTMQVTETNQSPQHRLLELDKDITAIRERLKADPAIRLVILDPLSNYMGHINMNHEQEVRRVLTPLQELAQETGVAILGVMHLNKDENKRPTGRVSGAMAFVGVARSVWMFDSDKEMPDEFHMVRVKQNIAERKGGLKYRISTRNVVIEGESVPQPFVEWLGESVLSAHSLIAAHLPPSPPCQHL